jgi:hypothetical protein
MRFLNNQTLVLLDGPLVMLTDTAYIQQTTVNGELYTFLMEKQSEPNVYNATKYEKGDKTEAKRPPDGGCGHKVGWESNVIITF